MSPEEQLEEAKKSVVSLVEEVRKCGVAGVQLAEQLQLRHKEADALRTRLRKVTSAFEAASSYLTALEAYRSPIVDSEAREVVQAKRSEYSKALLELETADG